MIIPFTEEFVKGELCGRILVMGLRNVGEPEITRLNDNLELSKEPGDGKTSWRIEEGCLCLLSERDSVTDVFSGLEVIGGRVVIVGDTNTRARTKPCRLVLYEKQQLGTDFRVVISSHVDYETQTVPRIIRSLRREGIPDDCITVVVGGAKEEATIEEGYTKRYITDNLLGCTGLVPLLKGTLEVPTSYVLLLHDTCEAVSGFEEKVKSIDIGLPYDIIEASREIGLWSTDFIKKILSIDGFTTARVPLHEKFNNMKSLAGTICTLQEPKKMRAKDVYGTGTMRQVLDIESLGIKKYMGNKQSGGRP